MFGILSVFVGLAGLILYSAVWIKDRKRNLRLEYRSKKLQAKIETNIEEMDKYLTGVSHVHLP